MIKTFLFTISVFVLIFVEHFFLKVFAFSLFAFLGIYFWDKSRLTGFAIYFIATGLILDVTMHLPLGLHALALSVPVLFAWLSRVIVPYENSITEYIIFFISTLLYYIVFLVLQTLLQDFTLPYIVLKDIIYILLVSLGSTGIYFVIGLFTKSLRSKDFEKIRLR